MRAFARKLLCRLVIYAILCMIFVLIMMYNRTANRPQQQNDRRYDSPPRNNKRYDAPPVKKEDKSQHILQGVHNKEILQVNIEKEEERLNQEKQKTTATSSQATKTTTTTTKSAKNLTPEPTPAKEYEQTKDKPSSTCYFRQNNEDKPYPKLEGIDFAARKELLYDKSSVVNFLPQYKNPCWMEKLPKDFEKQYKKSQYYERHGMNHLKTLQPVLEQRLNSSSPWRLRCLPYLFVVGVTKSGTTDVFDTLAMHPDVHVPWVKEPMYWNRHRYPSKSACTYGQQLYPHKPFESYLNSFDLAAHQINQTGVNLKKCGVQYPGITLDGSSYLFWEDYCANHSQRTTSEDIKELLPDAKILVMMRNPTSRFYSFFNMRQFELKKEMETPEKFHERVTKNIKSHQRCFKEHGERNCAYNSNLTEERGLTAGLYSVFLKEWWKVFPKKQVMLVKSEDYYEDRDKFAAKIFRFLGLRKVNNETMAAISKKRPSYQRKYPPLQPKTRALLDEFYKPFNEELESMLGRTMW